MFAALKARLPTSSFGKNIVKLAIGTAIGQAIAILASPTLTRLYSPDDFGTLAVYSSIIGILGAVASLCYHQAIPISESDDEAASVFGLSIILTLVLATLVTIIVATVGRDVAIFLRAPALASYLWMIPLGVLGLASYEIMNQWAIRQKSFAAISRTSISKGITQTGTHLAFGFAASSSFGLLLGQLLGQWAGLGGLLRNALHENGHTLRGITLVGMKNAAKRFSKFLQFTSPATLFNVAGRDTPPLILNYFFGGAVAGFFTLGERVLMLPVTLLAKSASQVFVASAPTYYREGRLSVEVEHLFERMLRLSIAPVIILGLSSPDLFSFVFGDAWSETGHYVRWLAAWLLFVFIGFALSPIIFVLERQKVGMWFQGVMAIGRMSSLIIGGITGSAILAVALFGLVSGLLWAIYLGWILHISGVSLRRTAQICTHEFFVNAPFAIPVAFCTLNGTSKEVTFLIVALSVSAVGLWSITKKNS